MRLERTVSWSQTRRDTNFAIPGYSISAIIPRRRGKSKIFLSVVIYVVKAAFVPFSAAGGKPAIASAARHSGLLPKPRMDRVYPLPNHPRYTRLWSFCRFKRHMSVALPLSWLIYYTLTLQKVQSFFPRGFLIALHISATRYIFNSLNAAKIAVAWYSCMW